MHSAHAYRLIRNVPQSLKTMTSLSQKHLVADTISTVNVLKDGQNCPLLTTIRYDAPTAEQCIRTKNTASFAYERKQTTKD